MAEAPAPAPTVQHSNQKRKKNGALLCPFIFVRLLPIPFVARALRRAGSATVRYPLRCGMCAEAFRGFYADRWRSDGVVHNIAEILVKITIIL